MTDLGMTWTTADAYADKIQRSGTLIAYGLGLRTRGSKEKIYGVNWTAEELSWVIRLQYVLCTTWREVPAAEVITALPSPDTLDSYVGNIGLSPGEQWRIRTGFGSLTLVAALVCEKLERLADALLYVAKALRTEPRQDSIDADHARRAAVIEAASTEAKEAAAAITAMMHHAKSFPEAIQGAMKGALEKGNEGVVELVTLTVKSPQTKETAGKSDEFKATVAGVLVAGDFGEVLKAQFPEVNTTVSHVNDPTIDLRPTTTAQGQALRGRMLAATGKKVEAEAAFEQAIEVSHRTGLRLFEMLALRDLKKCILDADGRGDEGTKRLKVALQEMKGPPAELTRLLGGVDAEEILRS